MNDDLKGCLWAVSVIVGWMLAGLVAASVFMGLLS